MRKYQVWLGGHELLDVIAKSSRDAAQQAREQLCCSRLPNRTTIYEIREIPFGHYKEIIRMNRETGFHAGNL
jgi:hypothetical protein